MNFFNKKKERIIVRELLMNPPSLENSNPNISTVPVLPQLSVALGLLGLVFGVTYVGTSAPMTKGQTESNVRVEAELVQTEQRAQSLAHAFDATKLEARSAIVWDVQNQKILFNKNADDQLPLASVTKLMTALVAYELLDPKQKVAISMHALKTEGDSGFSDGEEFTMQNLLDLTLIASSNDGAAALGATAGKAIDPDMNSDRIFVEAMNLKAKELGLSKTYFNNSTGLDLSETKSGGYGSARDMALLMEYVITQIPDSVALTNLGMKKIINTDGAYHIAKNTNDVVNEIDGLLASKTGYTQLAGGNLVIAFNAGLSRPIVITVLGSSQEGRFTDILSLVKKTKAYLEAESNN